MSNIIDKKTILKDPVIYYQSFAKDADSEKLNSLYKLNEKYLSELKTLQEIKKESGITSRKIGQELKDSIQHQQLIASMKLLSKQRKNLLVNIKAIEEDILSIINTAATTVNQSEDSKERNKSRRSIDLAQITLSHITIDECSNTEEWNKYIQSHPNASVYHLHDIKAIIEKTFSHNCIYLSARDTDNNIVGILPLVQLKSRIFGNFLVSIPFFNYGSALTDDQKIDDLLINKAISYAKSLNCEHIEFRDTVKRTSMPARTDKVNMILNLPGNVDSLWDNFNSKLRSQIKRAQREQTTTKNGGVEKLDDFYQVFSRNMRDLGTPVYSKEFFRNILTTFPDNSQIILIYLNNKPVAGAFLMGMNDRLEIPWASTIKAVNHLSINMLLYWQVLQYAINNGYKKFDFGRSTPDTGTYRFKKQWGAKPLQLYWNYWLPGSRDIPVINPSNPKYALFIKIWKRLPLFITKLIGPFVIKNIP